MLSIFGRGTSKSPLGFWKACVPAHMIALCVGPLVPSLHSQAVVYDQRVVYPHNRKRESSSPNAKPCTARQVLCHRLCFAAALVGRT